MSIDELNEAVVLRGGKILSILLRPMLSNIEVNLVGWLRKPYAGSLGPVIVKLAFMGALRYSFTDPNLRKTGGGYSDITFIRLANGRYYLSLDPYNTPGAPHGQDENALTADQVTITLTPWERVSNG